MGFVKAGLRYPRSETHLGLGMSDFLISHCKHCRFSPPIAPVRRYIARGPMSSIHGAPQIVFELRMPAKDDRTGAAGVGQWSNFHLHRFVIRGKEYGVSRMGCTTFTTDVRKVLLSQFGFRVNEGE